MCVRLSHVSVVLYLLAMTVIAGGSPAAAAADGNGSAKPAAKSKGGNPLTLTITSTAFVQGHPIPKKYTGEGADISPPLAWTGIPDGAKELALICDDPDAPTREPWVHWVLYKISVKTKGTPEGMPRRPRPKDPPGTLQGKNSWPDGDTIGYRGPMPPPGHGVHHYYFKLYALDAEVDLGPGLSKNAVLEKIRGHILAEGVLMGTYERRKGEK
jgi:Raf kinase inhibitor-like YbhB/YbcL family protein